METTMNRQHNAGGFLILLGIAIVVLAALIGAASQHATTAHGSEASDVLACLKNGSTYQGMVFKGKDNRFYLPCQLPDGRIGLGIFTNKGDNITAFVPKDGVWASRYANTSCKAPRSSLALCRSDPKAHCNRWAFCLKSEASCGK